jgi:hypothetical protein
MAIPRNLANFANQLNGDGDVPKIEVGDSKVEVTDTGSNGTIVFNTDGSEAMRVDNQKNVGIGTTSPSGRFDIESGSYRQGFVFTASGTPYTGLGQSANWDAFTNNGAGGAREFMGGITVSAWSATTGANTGYIIFGTAIDGTKAERARIDREGIFIVGKTATTLATAGFYCYPYGEVGITRNASTVLLLNRTSNDGTLVEFYQDGTQEGNISVSGSTVSYNGGHLSRWAQMLTKPDLLKGTVMSNLDEMNVYVKPTLYWTEDDELPVDEEGNPTVAVGDLKQETSVSENEQLNKVKVSDVEGDPNVAGVFVNWTYDEAHQVDEINMAMTGDMIIRIGEGVTVARGDLLMSAGDGTAKPQGDDIVRSKTIAKVTSTHVTCTYEDGSYCVPCVLMAC